MSNVTKMHNPFPPRDTPKFEDYDDAPLPTEEEVFGEDGDPSLYKTENTMNEETTTETTETMTQEVATSWLSSLWANVLLVSGGSWQVIKDSFNAVRSALGMSIALIAGIVGAAFVGGTAATIAINVAALTGLAVVTHFAVQVTARVIGKAWNWLASKFTKVPTTEAMAASATGVKDDLVRKYEEMAAYASAAKAARAAAHQTAVDNEAAMNAAI